MYTPTQEKNDIIEAIGTGETILVSAFAASNLKREKHPKTEVDIVA